MASPAEKFVDGQRSEAQLGDISAQVDGVRRAAQLVGQLHHYRMLGGVG